MNTQIEQRDPRLDPVAGDVTMNRNGCTFRIRRIDEAGRIWYLERDLCEELSCDLDFWRECSADDTIIQRGDA